MGGYHQVPSTTHLDSLLVCKARGMALRQVVLLLPCAVLHQSHPAPGIKFAEVPYIVTLYRKYTKSLTLERKYSA